MKNLTIEQLTKVANAFREDNWLPTIDKGNG